MAVVDNEVRLYVDGVTGDNQALADEWGGLATVVYGNGIDTWGVPLTPSDIDDDFGFAISVDIDDGSEAEVYYAEMTITYEIEGASRSQTSVMAFGPGGGHPENPTIFTGYGNETSYYILPRPHLRPDDDPNYEFQNERPGEIIGAYQNVGAKSFTKALNGGRVLTQNVNAGKPVDLEYDVDGQVFVQLMRAEQAGVVVSQVNDDVFFGRIRYRIETSTADEAASPVILGAAFNSIVLPPRKRMWSMDLICANDQVQVGGGSLPVAKSQQEKLLYDADQRIVTLYDRDGNTFRARVLGVTASGSMPLQRSDATVYTVTMVEINDITPLGNLFVLDRDAINGDRILG